MCNASVFTLGLFEDGFLGQTAHVTSSKTPPVVIFDGECAVCNGAIRRLLRMDKAGALRITGSASDVGQALIARAGLPASIADESVVFVQGDQAWTHSTAIAKVISHLPYPYRLGAAMRFVPVPVRDAAYRFISNHRKKIDGADAACGVPTPALRTQWQRQLATMEEFTSGAI